MNPLAKKNSNSFEEAMLKWQIMKLEEKLEKEKKLVKEKEKEISKATKKIKKSISIKNGEIIKNPYVVKSDGFEIFLHEYLCGVIKQNDIKYVAHIFDKIGNFTIKKVQENKFDSIETFVSVVNRVLTLKKEKK